jgi:hypothetical protein
VLGGLIVTVVAEPEDTDSPLGISSQRVYNVITEPASPFEPCVPLVAAITRMKVLRYPDGPVLAVCVNNVVLAVDNPK